ncbi:MAG: YwaF family protein [Clostridia bacterium]|nr:YwaF family protein [Clostridia bacterium]
MFKYFFTNEHSIEALGLDIGFRLYSVGHILWLIFIIASGIVISSWYKKQSTDIRRIVRRIFALFMAITEAVRDLLIAFTGCFAMEYLPLHLCGLALFFIAADAFIEKQKLTRQMIAYAFMPGAVSALLFCNWTIYPFFNYMNIHSFAFHAYIIWYFLMRYRAGEIMTEYKGIWKTLAVIVALVPPMFMLNKVWGTNFMFLNESSAGSPLVPLWNIFYTRFGYVGYILSEIALVTIVLHAVYGIYKLIERRK